MVHLKFARLVIVGLAAVVLVCAGCSGDDDSSSDDPGADSPIDRADPTTSSAGGGGEAGGAATGELPGEGGSSAQSDGASSGNEGGQNDGESGGEDSGEEDNGGGESGGEGSSGGDEGAGQPSGYQVTVCADDDGCGADEICLIARWSDTKGICTEKCGGTGSNSPCESAERETHGLSQMCIGGSVTRTNADGTTETRSYQACGYLCKDEFGETYNCPADTTCWDLNPNQAICLPPQ